MFNLVATLFGVEQWLVIMVLVLLLFGGKKIPELMRGVGRGVGELQKGLDEGKRALQSSLHEDEEIKARRAEKLETEKEEVVSANPK